MVAGGAPSLRPDHEAAPPPAGPRTAERVAHEANAPARLPDHADVTNAARLDDVAVRLAPAGRGMERQESVGGRPLEAGEGAVRSELDQAHGDDPVAPQRPPPAPAALAFGDGPDHRATLRQRTPTGAPEPGGHRPLAPSVPSKDSAQRPDTARSSPASDGAMRPFTRTSRSPYSSSIVPRSRTRASNSPAAYGTWTSTS